MNQRFIEIQQREDEVANLVNSILGLPWGSTSTNAASSLGGDMSIIVRLPKEYRKFRLSEYYFTEKSITHFTNIEAALSILESCKIRLYNLYYKNDENEFFYASDILNGFSKPTESFFYDYNAEVKAIRFNTFILSATSNEKVEDFWVKDYSRNGRGIGFEFSFCNNIDDWKGFYLSPVKYGHLEKFVQFRDSLLNLEKTYKNIDYKINLNQVIPFHKEQKWSDESEIRLMTFSPEDNKLQIYCDKNDDKIKCINLPIMSNEFTCETFTIKTIPFLKVERVFIGPKLSKTEIEKIRLIIEQNYFYDIKIDNYVT